jgi:hypothetical protein
VAQGASTTLEDESEPTRVELGTTSNYFRKSSFIFSELTKSTSRTVLEVF